MVDPRDIREEDVNFLKEMVGHPASVSGLFGAITAGAIVSIAVGMGPAALPLVFYLGAQAIGALFVPSSPVFREYTLRRKRAEAREASRQHLTDRIKSKAQQADLENWSSLHDYWERYRQMRERLASLGKVAAHSQTSLSSYDLEKLDDATLDYLRLIYARMLLQERINNQDDREIYKQIRDIDQQLGQARSAVDQKRLEQARKDLERMLDRRKALPAKDAAAAAQLLTMSEAFEEVYHRITTDPMSKDVGNYLREATDRLSVEEELEMQVDDELEQLSRRARLVASKQ